MLKGFIEIFMKIGKDTIEIKGLISREDYKKNRNEIESGSKLQFYNNKDDFNLRLQNMKHDSIKYYFFSLIALLFLFFLSLLFKDEVPDGGMKKILPIVIWIAIGALAWFLSLFIRDQLISKCTKHSIFFFPLLPLLFLYLFYNVFDQSGQYRIPGFIFMSILLFLVSNKFNRFLPLYMIDSYNKNITIVLTVVTLIFGPDLTSDCGMVSLSYLLNITLIQIILNSRLEKNQSEAEKIFEKILIDDIDDKGAQYADLRRCYAKGGNKYREKILENKQFLKVINDIEKNNC